MTGPTTTHLRASLSGRRAFLRTAGALAAGAALGLRPAEVRGLRGAGAGGQAGPRPGARSPAPAQGHPWGRLEPVADGVWALVSSPLAEGPDARRTLCNGGIIAGRQGVLVVEAFATMDGAAWMSDQALRLAGARPTHVVLTHYHGDHATGAAGFLLSGRAPRYLATRTTRRLLSERETALADDATEARPLLLPDIVLPDRGEPTELDLGGRTVRLRPRRGHTLSDLVVETDGIVFAGDLVWNGMFPNYVDAIPSALARQVRALRDQDADLYVSGHGELADGDALDRYIELLDDVEAAARRALAAGRPLDEAGADYAVPTGLGDWHMFSPRYPEVAFRAWERELGD
ncbi:MAG: MBL fold metallo-hydrolase [Gemmatimonadetes bacterium]|nr:MBL fold metallo-hydrolase [Gemmatimonadota bacterium]NIQ58176.1 MBL fold metallo-hydrolase [Gemmatimonadota bacterium]NIU78382.1 MBL fold metallo-hydrolase [Gammaproteobacteria bacterium]NIX47313.1 MBL fold metallo-hydrolase [Gemmatimonadota bacterium]NIY11687.1 MBL fold metallo-hydrolase [Gemmatimonadota bacterium]